MKGDDARRNYPRRFVGLDLETTGVEPTEDRIIEVGAARIVDGAVDETVSFFVNPGRPIPADVVYLTGITDGDVKGAPPIAEVLPLLSAFVGGDPVVAHQASFDMGFLDVAAAGRAELGVGRAEVFDTLTLARALLPRLPNHRLGTLAGFFDLPHERAHRAGDDALAVSLVFLRLVSLLGEVGTAILARMASLADPTIRKLIEAAREGAEGRIDPFALPDHGPKAGQFLRYDNARRTDIERVPRDERVMPDPGRLEALFERGGPIASRLPGYETRGEQLEMMRAVADAFAGGIDLVVEAGTGVGKSLAYLVPAIAFAADNGERVIVSTNTKNLQEQLFTKDIPFLEGALDTRFSSALLKGRGSYLCVLRWRQILEKGLSPAERAELLPIVLWEAETTSGDVSENAAFRQLGYLWNRISAEGGPCLGQKCPASDRCYLLRARRAAQSAHIVVVNHSLLFSDTETGGRILGDYGWLVCDEAHNIESVATEHLGRRAGVWRARAALDAIYRKDGAETGDLADLLAAVGAEPDFGILSTLRVAAERLRDDVRAASRAGEGFFRALSLRFGELGGEGAGDFGKLRYRDDASVASLLAGELHDAAAAFRAVSDGAEALAGLVADSDLRETESPSQAMLFHAERTRRLADDLEYLASAADPDAVFWIEIRGESAEPDCELRCAPISVAAHMESFLYERVETLVLTSATLTVDGSFEFFMERAGLSLLPDWRVLALNVGSPYDYERQSIAVVAGYLPPPSSPGFNGVVADLVVKLAAPAKGGTLVLFTSRSALDSVFKAVRDPLTARGKLVLAQGHGGGASALLEQFAKKGDSVLLATASFWEGIDVPGSSLEQLVIAKLPFPVPSDPVVEAHCERYEAEGENAFERYMVPRTAVKLRQGFGRLIRSTTDTGVVVFLDSRLKTKSYGERLLAELPTRALVAESEGELLRALSLSEAKPATR